jgi:predicted phosphohydrolase
VSNSLVNGYHEGISELNKNTEDLSNWLNSILDALENDEITLTPTQKRVLLREVERLKRNEAKLSKVSN